MLKKLKGIWIGTLDGKLIAIIDLDEADPAGMKSIDDLINERRRNGQRCSPILVRVKSGNPDVEVRREAESTLR